VFLCRFLKNVGLLFTYSLWPEGYLDGAKWFKGLKGQGSEVKRPVDSLENVTEGIL
jgi:hypothetical protein